MLETKNDTVVSPSQIELDSLLAWRLQAEEYKRVYQLSTPSSFLFVQESTSPSYQFQSAHGGEALSFSLKLTKGDGDCFFHAVNKPDFTRDALVKKLFDNPTEAVRNAFAHEIRQFLYLGLSGIHPGGENRACQRLLTADIRERFLTLEKVEETLRVKVDKARSALGTKETHGKCPLELLTLLREKKSPLASEFEQAYQAVLNADKAIYEYCCRESVFKNYVQYYLKEARGYIPFSRDFGGETPITTIDVINQLFGLKIQVYLPSKPNSTQLQLANRLQIGEVIPIYHNGINHFSELEKQNPQIEPDLLIHVADEAKRKNFEVSSNVVKLEEAMKKLSLSPEGENILNNKPYLKSEHLIPGLKGTTYQVAVLMKYAFTAYKENRDFELLTEAADFEKFDDLVLYYKDRIEVAQIKHGHSSESEYTLRDFIDDPTKKEKKVQLSKYFDAWFNIRQKNNNKKIIYKLISNYKIAINLNGILENGKFSDDFKNNRLDPENTGYRTEIIESIKRYSTAFNVESRLRDIRIRLYPNVIAEILSAPEISNPMFDINRNDQWQLFLSAFIIYENDNAAKLVKGFKKQWCFIGKAIPDAIRITAPKIQTIKNKINKLFDLNYFSNIENNLDFSNDRLATLLCAGYVEPVGGGGLYKFNEQFITDNNLTPLQKYFRGKLVTLIKEKSSLNDSPRFDGYIKNFLAEFIFEVDQLSVESLEEWLRKEVLSHFNTVFSDHYELFYVHMLHWLRDSRYIQTQKTLDEVFREANARLPWHYLTKVTNKYIKNKKIGRDKNLLSNVTLYHELNEPSFQNFSDFISSETTNCLLITGMSSFANTTFVRDFLTAKKVLEKEGEWLFFPARKIISGEDFSFGLLLLFSKELKYIILDRAEEILSDDNREYVQVLLQGLTSKGKKLILVVSSLNPNIRSFINNDIKRLDVPSLNKLQIEAVKNSYHDVNTFSLFGRKFSVTYLSQGQEITLFRWFENLNYLVEILDSERSKKLNSVQKEENEVIPYRAPHIYESRLTYDLKQILDGINEQGCFIQLKARIELERGSFIQNLSSSFKTYSYLEVDKANFGLEKKELEESQGFFIDASQYNERKLDEKFVQVISEYARNKKIIIFLSKETQFFELKDYENTFQMFLIDSEKRTCVVEHQNTKIPLVSDKSCKWDYGEYQTILRKPIGSNRVVVQSKAGLGKSRLCQEILKASRNMSEVSNDLYHFVFLLDLSELSITDLNCLRENSVETLFSLITQKILEKNEITIWQEVLLKQALHEGQVLMIYDGLDEVAVDQVVRFKSLFDCLFDYPHFLLCSRPEVPLQFSPTKIIKLDFFDKQKIFEYVDGYLSAKKLSFGNDPGFRDMIQDKIDFVPHLIDLLKVPLHCQLFCNIVFEENQKPTAATFENIISLSLYQGLVLGKIRVYLTEKMGITKEKFVDVEHLYVFCGKVLGQMAKAAFLQIGFLEGRDSCFDLKNENEIAELALVSLEKKENVDGLEKVVFRFPHRTIEEYFAALYIAKGLCKENQRNEFYHLIKKYRYNPRYEVIWQILTSILFNGDPFVGKSTSNGLLLFCYALIATPRDLIGHRHQELVKSCFVNCDLNKIIDINLRAIFVSAVKDPKTPVVTRTPFVMRSYFTPSKPFCAQAKSVIEVNLSEIQKLEKAKKIFNLPAYDLRCSVDVSSFNMAYNYFVSLKDEKMIKEAMQFLLSYVETVCRSSFDHGVSLKKPRYASKSSDNKLGFALDVLSVYSPLSPDNEKFICWAIFSLYLSTDNSDSLDMRLLKTLSGFTFRSEETIAFLKQKILDLPQDSPILTSTINCLKKSSVIDELVVDNLLKNAVEKDSITALKSLFDFLERPNVLIFVKDFLITLIQKRGLGKFDRLKKLIDKIINSFSETQLHSLVQTIFEIFSKNNAKNVTYLFHAPMDLLFYLLKEKKIAFESIKRNLIDCLANTGLRKRIVEVLEVFDSIDEKIVNELLTLDDHSSESCEALLSLPKEFIDDQVVTAIIKCERDALNYLKILIERNLDFSQLSNATKKDIRSRCRKYVNFTWQSENLLFVLQHIFGIEKSLKIFINTSFPDPLPLPAISPSPLLENNNLITTPPVPVKFSLTEKYREFEARFKVIDKLITENAIRYCWKRFLKEFFCYF